MWFQWSTQRNTAVIIAYSQHKLRRCERCVKKSTIEWELVIISPYTRVGSWTYQAHRVECLADSLG